MNPSDESALEDPKLERRTATVDTSSAIADGHAAESEHDWSPPVGSPVTRDGEGDGHSGDDRIGSFGEEADSNIDELDFLVELAPSDRLVETDTVEPVHATGARRVDFDDDATPVTIEAVEVTMRDVEVDDLPLERQVGVASAAGVGASGDGRGNGGNGDGRDGADDGRHRDHGGGLDVSDQTVEVGERHDEQLSADEHRSGIATDLTSANDSSESWSPGSGSTSQQIDPELGQVQPAVEPRQDRLPKLGVLTVAIVVIAARFAFAYDRIIYQLAPDEPGSLAMARYLSGGVRFTMFDFNTWRPGLAVLLAPVNAVTSDPPTLMRAAFAINAVLAAIATIILARLAVRLTKLPTWACLFAAATISLTAPSLSASAHVWAESLVTLTTLWLIAALIRFFDEPKLAPAISASTATAIGVLSHGRLLPLLPVMILAVGFTFVRTRRFDRLWKWGAYTAVVSAATILFTNWVFAEVWDSPGGTNTVGTVLNRIVNIPAVARSMVGQLWYQMVVTFGIFGVGLAILTWHALRRRRRLPLTRDARVVLIVTLPLILTSIAFMAERTRTDHRIYGRYNDAVVWPILIVGIGWLASRVGWTRRLAMLVGVLATTVGAGALVYVFDGTAMADSVGVRPMIAGFLPLVGTASTLDPWLLTAAGAAGTIILFALLPWRRLTAVTVTTVIVLLAIGGYRTHNALATRLNSWAAAGAVVEIDEIIDPHAPLAFRMVRDKEDPAASWTEQRRRSLLYQVYLPEHAFERDQGPDDGGSPYVFAPLDDPVMTEVDATLVWTDETVKIGLWVEPGAPYTAPEPETVAAGPPRD